MTLCRVTSSPHSRNESGATRRSWEGSSLTLVWPSSIGTQEQPILRFAGRVTYVAPREMLVALDSGGVVMLDLARNKQIQQSGLGWLRRRGDAVPNMTPLVSRQSEMSPIRPNDNHVSLRRGANY